MQELFNLAFSYRWYPSDNLSCNDCSSPILTASKDTVYYLEIIDQNGCLTLDSIIIRIIKSTNNDIYLPTIFSPNDDNINDIWIPIVGSSDIDIYQISIYDRWGAMVFSTTTLAGWNGKIGSQPAIPGVYAYFISWQDGQGVRHNTRGDITLVR
ncbi:MAG: gliding motility-associated C-terminal domain-containing protein [Saprospiraceae bacterium]|nr:gliding motility-associated C-terminal domain-containing protein [Candidatus Vicinibacter affinis]